MELLNLCRRLMKFLFHNFPRVKNFYREENSIKIAEFRDGNKSKLVYR